MRGTWTPSPYLAAQVSHGFLKTPEEAHPDENEHRTTASVQYARGGLTTTLAFSLKDRSPGEKLSAFLGEANWEITPRHAVFGSRTSATTSSSPITTIRCTTEASA